MTNLERYKDELKECIKNNAREIATVYMNVGNGFSDFSKKYINCYPGDSVAFVDWLLEEHKEPIKLTQFEYDLLMSYINKGYSFKNHSELKEMRNKGYFEGVTDTYMTLKEILDNCEVIEE